MNEQPDEPVGPQTYVFLLLGDGTMSWVNAQPEGVAAEEVIGQRVWKRCHPEDENRVRDAYVKIMVEQTEFHGTVRTVRGERAFVSMQALPVLQPSQLAVVGWARRLSDEAETLTDRERDVLLLVCDELTSSEIAKRLIIAVATVETHRQNIAKKLGVNTVVGMVRAAIRSGLLDP